MTQEEAIRHWLKSAKNDQKTAQSTYDNQHYNWAFFLWQLTIEKLFKGLVVKAGKTPIHTHDLLRLSKQAKIPFNSEKQKQLEEITTYNIDARYDTYKLDFYNKTKTLSYRKKWSKTCKEIIQWLKKMY